MGTCATARPVDREASKVDTMEQNRTRASQVDEHNASKGPTRRHEFPPSGTYRADAASALTRVELQPRVLLGLPADAECLELARRLRVSGRMRLLEIDPHATDGSQSVAPVEVDVAVLHASCLSLNCAGLAHDPAFGFPELVFAVDESCPAQRLALLSRGYRHVISVTRLDGWLHEQLVSLCALAQARRIVIRAACTAPTQVAALSLATSPGVNMNLHLAETHFRETFLRALLVEQGSRRRAAEAAGVPYRSFCEMLRRFGL